MLTVVNPDTRLVHLKGIEEPYCERVGHPSGDLSAIQPGYFGSRCGRLRSTRQRVASEDQRYDAEAHALVDASQSAGLDGDAGLLENFSPRCVARILVQLGDPASQDPFPGVGPLEGQHPAVFTDNRASSTNRMTREIVG
jgi:hypothetical protein